MRKIVLLISILIAPSLIASDALSSISFSFDGKGRNGFVSGIFTPANPVIKIDNVLSCKIIFGEVERRVHNGVTYISQKGEVNCFENGHEAFGSSLSCSLCGNGKKQEMLSMDGAEYEVRFYCTESYSKCQ